MKTVQPAIRLKSLFLACFLLAFAGLAIAGSQRTVLTNAENKIIKQMGGLRAMTDADRAVATKSFALQIRQLPPDAGKVLIAYGLANESTEGDFGRDTLQAVTTTLEQALRETPPPQVKGEPDSAYLELAQLAKFENMRVTLRSADYTFALAQLDAINKAREAADFTLNDIQGNSWTLSALKGKVVLVNFWATWCPPCRKEMPDMETLYNRFKDQGFVVLAISDEDISKVNPFIATNKYTYPILLDPGRKINEAYKVDGIPKSFIYDRNGKLVAQSIDMRTQKQFLELLSKAGLK